MGAAQDVEAEVAAAFDPLFVLLYQICRQIYFGKPVKASTSARASSKWVTTAGSFSSNAFSTRSN